MKSHPLPQSLESGGTERQVRFKSTVHVLMLWHREVQDIIGSQQRGIQSWLRSLRKHLSWAGGGSREFQRSRTVYAKAGHCERLQTCHLVVFGCIWPYSKAKITLSLMTRAMSYISVYLQNLLCSLYTISAPSTVISDNGCKASHQNCSHAEDFTVETRMLQQKLGHTCSTSNTFWAAPRRNFGPRTPANWRNGSCSMTSHGRKFLGKVCGLALMFLRRFSLSPSTSSISPPILGEFHGLSELQIFYPQNKS